MSDEHEDLEEDQEEQEPTEEELKRTHLLNEKILSKKKKLTDLEMNEVGESE